MATEVDSEVSNSVNYYLDLVLVSYHFCQPFKRVMSLLNFMKIIAYGDPGGDICWLHG